MGLTLGIGLWQDRQEVKSQIVGLGFRGLGFIGFRGLGFRGLGFRE